MALRLMAAGLAGRTHLSAQKNMMAEDARVGGVRGGREGGRGGRGHASGTHQCSPHTGQFIRIIKACLALKVKLTINLTWIQKERD